MTLERLSTADRSVESTDAMKAEWADPGKSLLAAIGNRIVNEVPGADRVGYDGSTKPPSTSDWE